MPPRRSRCKTELSEELDLSNLTARRYAGPQSAFPRRAVHAGYDRAAWPRLRRICVQFAERRNGPQRRVSSGMRRCASCQGLCRETTPSTDECFRHVRREGDVTDPWWMPDPEVHGADAQAREAAADVHEARVVAHDETSARGISHCDLVSEHEVEVSEPSSPAAHDVICS